MKVYESADFNWNEPQNFAFWEWVEPIEVRSIALELLRDYYKAHSAPLLNKSGYYGHYDGGEKDGQEVPWWDSGPSEDYIHGLEKGLLACAGAGTLPITAPRVRENEEGSAKYGSNKIDIKDA